MPHLTACKTTTAAHTTQHFTADSSAKTILTSASEKLSVIK